MNPKGKELSQMAASNTIGIAAVKEASKSVEEFRGLLAENIYEKKELIDIMCVSYVAEEPLLIIGPPGTAKSMLVNRFCELLGFNDDYRRVQDCRKLIAGASGKELVEALSSFSKAETKNSGAGDEIQWEEEASGGGKQRSSSGDLQACFGELLDKTGFSFPRFAHFLKRSGATKDPGAPDFAQKVLDCFVRAAGLRESGCGRKYFSYLLTPFTDPAEIFGPVDIQKLLGQMVSLQAGSVDKYIGLQSELTERINEGALSASRYERITRNMLPEAEVAFLDEVFKANSAILNSLLTIINERKYYQPDGSVDVPLKMLFAASNRLPRDEELNAFLDRFPLRVWSRSIFESAPEDTEQIRELLKKAEAGEGGGSPDEAEKRRFSEAFDTLRNYLRLNMKQFYDAPRRGAKKDPLEQFFRFIGNVSSDDGAFLPEADRKTLSDRRLRKLVRLMCARSLTHASQSLDWRDAAKDPFPLSMEDLVVLKHIWSVDEPYHIKELESKVENFIEPKSEERHE